MVLTRYLYPKKTVIFSLYISIANQTDIQEAYFWAYELYFSGFRAETIELLIKIYDEYFKREPVKPALQKWLSKQYEKWKDDMTQDTIIATIIENMFKREPDTEKFLQKIGTFSIHTPDSRVYSQTPIFIIAREPKWQTVLAKYTKGWKLPREVCVYQCYREPIDDRPYDIDKLQQNWLLWASGSPIWRTRIKKYGGKITDTAVIFPDELSEEEFLNWYNMEPDEQPIEIQDAWLGV